MARKKRDEELEAWLASMEDGIASFLHSLPTEIASQMDYSIESLDVLEAWLLERYPTFEQAVQEEASQDQHSPHFLNMGRYIGETFCKLAGGHWFYERGRRFVAYHGRPLIQINGLSPQCPRWLATTAASRRTGGMFSKLVRTAFKSQAVNRRRANITPETLKQAFDTWMAAMDQQLAWLLAQMPPETAAQMDYSVDSLDLLYAWLLERYPAGPETDAVFKELDYLAIVDPAAVPPLLDAASRYVGETMRKYLGGRWCYDPTLKESLGGELPLIVGYSRGESPDPPMMYVTLAMEARDPTDTSTTFRQYKGAEKEHRALLKGQRRR